MRVDAHQHFWQIGRYDYVWMGPELGVLRNDFGQGELKPNLERHGLNCSVLVQTISSFDETRWFMELAREHDFIGGVVGWVDLQSPQVGRTLDELRELPGLVGIRHQVHDELDDGWLVRDDVCNGLGELARRGIAYDLLIRPQHLAVSLEVARRFGDLTFVIDHIAKPAIAKGQWDDWANGIKKLARCPNVSCKLSGMITEADWDNWTAADIQPYVEHVIEVFGPERCMFGSDWPVCLLAGTYERVYAALEKCVDALSSCEQAEVFGNTAARAYGLEA